jgi:hypothetical protein
MIIEDSLSSIRQARENGAGCIVAVGTTATEAQLDGLADYRIADFTEFDPAWLHR